MMLDELIESLWELKRAYGEQEVKLHTQKDETSWREHNIDFATYDGYGIVIVGKEKSKAKTKTETKDK